MPLTKEIYYTANDANRTIHPGEVDGQSAPADVQIHGDSLQI